MKSLPPLLLATLLGLPIAARAQNELSNFTATGRGGVVNTFALDYQALGINPANLGRASESRVAFTVGEFGIGAASQSLSKSLFKRIINNDEPLTPAAKVELLGGFSGDNALNLNADLTTLALSVRLPAGLGGLAVGNRQRLAGHLSLNQNAADILINGREAAIIRQYYDPVTGQYLGGSAPPPVLSAVLDGSVMQLALTNEFNVAYGNRIIDFQTFNLSVGVGYRYIQGLGVADVRVRDGEFQGYSALAPVFDVDYGAAASSGGFNRRDGGNFQTVGHGHGFDLGLAAEIGRFVRLGVSVTDLGRMRWDGNLLTANDQPLQRLATAGMSDYDVEEQLRELFANKDGGLFTYEPGSERRVRLPTKLRLGTGVRVSDVFEVGLDVTAPLNDEAGNLESTFVGAGLDYKPVRWLRLSSGVSGGAGYGASLPLGLTLVTPVYEAGVSTRDVTGYFSEKSPYASVAFGFLRFKIGRL
ncbi:DUF5723 family protein [uncultured Hymenobacter sp.]|uniref:DUF5723 family protein n=1 Tax=uncultured Hymenobacter sp. TaxID=170016 RepID=UPI0035C97E6D